MERNPKALCETCPYWHDRYLKNRSSGYCHKYAPRGTGIDNDRYKHEFCGEHPEFFLPEEEV